MSRQRIRVDDDLLSPFLIKKTLYVSLSEMTLESGGLGFHETANGHNFLNVNLSKVRLRWS